MNVRWYAARYATSEDDWRPLMLRCELHQLDRIEVVKHSRTCLCPMDIGEHKVGLEDARVWVHDSDLHRDSRLRWGAVAELAEHDLAAAGQRAGRADVRDRGDP